jgi:crossover junction endonuclease MUS81
MNMIIKIDTREQDLYTQIKNLILFIPAFKSLTLVSETLPLGDIIILDEKEEKLIIERKCISDLLSSIKDGRYEEQSYRLNGLETHNHNIYYLIEGDVNRMNCFKDNNMEKMTIYSAIFSLNYFKGFSVMRTFSMEETANFICNTAVKINKTERLPYYKNGIQHAVISKQTTDKEQPEPEEIEATDKDYVNVIKKVKKENITENNIGEIMLCQIPGVSSVTAIAIMSKFKTIANLIKQFELNKDCLKNISYTNTKGQTRKITKTSIINIEKFLMRKENVED